MRRSSTLIIVSAMVLVACGPAEVIQNDPATTTTPTTTSSPTTTEPPNGEDHMGTTIPGDSDGEISLVDHPGWIEERWPVLEGVDPWAAAWGDPGLVILGYAEFQRDDSPVPNGLWFFDGSEWHETLIKDATVPDQWGFTPEVTDLVWFGDRYLAFLMGDGTTAPGRASMLTSVDGVDWKLEYIGPSPTAMLPAGCYATPESPPYPGTSAITRVRITGDTLSAVGWTVLDTGQNFISVPVIWRSTDGHSWTTSVLPNANFDNEWGADIAVGSLGYLVEAAGPVHQSASLWFSPDGDEWTYIGDRFDDQWRMLIGMAVGDQAMLALMQDLETEGQPLSLWRSTNGLDWEQVTAPFLDNETAEGSPPAAVTADRLSLIGTAVHGGATESWRSVDGLAWTQLPAVETPTGEPLIRPYPWLPQLTVVNERLALVATLPGTVIRWTEAAAVRSVILVASDDVLNVRSGPGVNSNIVESLSPNATDVRLTGREELVGTSIWVEIVTDEGTGWVNSYYLAEPESAADPFTDTHAIDLADQIAAVFAGRGDLTEASSHRGIFVAHHDRGRAFTNVDELLTDPTLHAWAGTGCSPEECPDVTPNLTFAEAVADSFLGAWNDDDRQVAVDEVIPGGNGLLPESIVPAEFANLHFVAVKDPGDNPDFGGIDWYTWYLYFTYEDEIPVLLGMSIDAWAP